MTKEILDSTTSYAVGGFGISLAMIVEISQWAQAIAVILGCLVVGVRLLSDIIKLYRLWKKDK